MASQPEIMKHFSTIFHIYHNLNYFQKLSFIYINNISFQVCFEFGRSSTFEYFPDSPSIVLCLYIFHVEHSHFCFKTFYTENSDDTFCKFSQIFYCFSYLSQSQMNKGFLALYPSISSTHFSQDLDVFLSIKVSYPARISLKLENIFLIPITCQPQSCQGLTFSSEYLKINLIWFLNEYSSLSLMEILLQEIFFRNTNT